MIPRIWILAFGNIHKNHEFRTRLAEITVYSYMIVLNYDGKYLANYILLKNIISQNFIVKNTSAYGGSLSPSDERRFANSSVYRKFGLGKIK